MEEYVRPDEIENDMGGKDGKLDKRMKEIFKLLEYAPSDIYTICDIGMGQGQISRYFANRGGGARVTGTGLVLDSYGVSKEEWEAQGIRIVDCNVEHMPFQDGEFDAAVASHILEHVANMGQALGEIHRILKRDGWLLLFIPAYSDYVCAGHINIGWNLGQLVYVLLLNGFDVKHGHFIHYGYSLCAYVRKSDVQLPPLRGDRGDIHILNKSGLFPFEISEKDGLADGFNGGNIKSINWEGAEALIKERIRKSWKFKMLEGGVNVIRKVIGTERCNAISYVMKKKEEKYNPSKVK